MVANVVGRNPNPPMAAKPRVIEVDLVQVIWEDACHARDKENVGPLKMMSFGFLLADSKHGVVVAQTQSAVGEFLDCLFIPKGCVIHVNQIPLPPGMGILSA